MFDGRLRDKLLFEDKDFTYSRRYFWAFNTLGVINDGIKSMRSAYLDTFTKDFWTGRHPTLWPLSDPDSPESREYLLRLHPLHLDLETAITDLQDIYDRNARTRDEIRSLREQLFSGSSVKESRRAIEQGDNIKILTSVSMIFLPLTFVTSVFGITQFEISEKDWRFAVTMVSVCIPFFLLIVILQTQAAMQAVRRSGLVVRRWVAGAWAQVGRGSAANVSGGVGIVGAVLGGGDGGKRRFRRRGTQVGLGPGALKRTATGTAVGTGTGLGFGSMVTVQGQTQSPGPVQGGKNVIWGWMSGVRLRLWGWSWEGNRHGKNKTGKEDEIV